MKPDINKLFKQSSVRVCAETDERILESACAALPPSKIAVHADRWRTIMHSRITKAALAATVIFIVYWLTLSNRGVSQVYAIEQTIEAINTVRSVHFKAELYKQGDIECWMLFEPSQSKPTHVCLFMPGVPYRKIDSPEGSFGYNAATNRYRVNTRDERKFNWYPDFANFFRESLEKAKDCESVSIAEELDSESGKPVYVIGVDNDGRKCKYIIDKESKLPIRFVTLETADFMKYYRQTIAVRNISFIEYNKPVPEGLFSIPAGARRVESEHDILVHPETGMAVGTLTPQEACEKIVRDVTDAMNRRDWETVQRLLFPFAPPPKEMEDKLPSDPSQPLVEILEIGTPYRQDGYWYVPLKSREISGTVKDEQVPVKFYEFDGNRYCKIMWPD